MTHPKEQLTREQVEALIHRLRQVAQAYPEDVFGSITDAERNEHGSLISRSSAGMGRHFSALFTEAADALAALSAAPPQDSEIPMVKRFTGRTIPDLTGREHICEWQQKILAAAPKPAQKW